jgi:(p)ppGpp synthase/HD superfamily hydrolase
MHRERKTRMTAPTARARKLSDRFTEALVYTTELHARQQRKGTDVPYIAHLLGVAAIVLEDGGDEDEAIAALLHDAVEDQGGLPILAIISERFGERVADIVQGCTDADTHPKPPWQERKEEYIAHVRHASPSVRRVSLADKLHNARAVLHDQRQIGDAIFDRFAGGKAGTIWYYRTLAHVFLDTHSGPNAAELDRVVTEIERLAGM